MVNVRMWVNQMMRTPRDSKSRLMGFSFVFLQLLCCPIAVYAQADKLIASPLEPIRMQLRWHHQFQFAGYYAAKEKGFYEKAGFDVTLVAGSPDLDPVKEVLAGRAQFAQDNSEVLLSRLQGEPLVAISAIFQHSPSVIVTLADSNIDEPRELAGKRMMSVDGGSDVSLLAMFTQQKVDFDEISIVSSSYQIDDLIDGKTDAFNAYLTNEPFFLEERGVDFNIINPRDYGIDFYSDILFTSEFLTNNSPAKVKRFRQATLEGWKYALAHSDEMIQLIQDKYNSEKSLNHMRYEALSVHDLIMPELLEVGYINPVRMLAMAQVFLDQGMVENLDGLEGFIFDGDDDVPEGIVSLLVAGSIFLLVVILIAIMLGFFNHRLQKEILTRREAEQKLKELAETDPLTNLLNRRAFHKRYNEELMRAQRYGGGFSLILIDLDRFKNINDNYGHEAGDRVLISVAELLLTDNRESDLASRFGGEEFLLLLPNTPLSEAAVYADRLCNKIRSMVTPLRDGSKVSITASLGVVEWMPADQDDMTILRADKAMYTAKSAGRNQVKVWSDAS